MVMLPSLHIARLMNKRVQSLVCNTTVESQLKVVTTTGMFALKWLTGNKSKKLTGSVSNVKADFQIAIKILTG